MQRYQTAFKEGNDVLDSNVLQDSLNIKANTLISPEFLKAFLSEIILSYFIKSYFLIRQPV